MNRRRFLSGFGVIVAAVLMFSTGTGVTAGPSKAAAPAREKTVINLTKAPDKQGMNEVETGEAAVLALQLGNLMQSSKGRTAIFLSLDGTVLADPAVVMNIPSIYNPDYPGDEAAQPGLLQAFLGAGGRVIVCPLCGLRRGLTEETTLPGIEWGNPDSIAELFSKAEQIISF